MHLFTLRRAVLLCAALVLVAFAPPAGAQPEARVRHAELAATGAQLLYDAIAQIRPDWLAAAEPNRIAVFVNGAYRGDARQLRSIVTDSVAAVRRSSAQFVRQTESRFPAGEFDDVLFVSTRGTGARPRGRVTVSLDGGMSSASVSTATQRALVSAGYSEMFHSYLVRVPLTGEYETRRDEFATWPQEHPLAFGGTVNYRVGPSWGVAVTALHTRTGSSAGYNAAADRTASSASTSMEGALLATGDLNVVRVGAGLAVQRVDWEWTRGWCQCEDERSSSTNSIGAAGELAVALPLGNLPVQPVMRAFGRYYLPTRTESALPGNAPLEIGGLMVTVGMSLATHF